MITETLLRAQEQQQPLPISGGEGANQPAPGSRVGGAGNGEGEGGQRPSTPSSNGSEPFEVIETMPEGKRHIHSTDSKISLLLLGKRSFVVLQGHNILLSLLDTSYIRECKVIQCPKEYTMSCATKTMFFFCFLCLVCRPVL